jgi:hypothetical protein
MLESRVFTEQTCRGQINILGDFATFVDFRHFSAKKKIFLKILVAIILSAKRLEREGKNADFYEVPKIFLKLQHGPQVYVNVPTENFKLGANFFSQTRCATRFPTPSWTRTSARTPTPRWRARPSPKLGTLNKDN